MKLKFISTLLVGFILSASPIANAGLIQFDAESAGYDTGDYANLSADGVNIVDRGNRGVNIAVFDQLGILQDTAVFDTNGFYGASIALADYIDDITAGFIVLLAVKDEATSKFTNVARLAIQTLGGSEDNISGLEYRSSYALIGIAGSGVGSRSAFESSSSEASVLVTDTINFADKGTVKVPAPATLAIFALGIIGLASRRFKK